MVRNLEVVSKKPKLAEMGSYYERRLYGDPYTGISVSSDDLGNTVYTSLGRKEQTLAGEVSSRLTVSEEGRQLIAMNPGLLRQVAEGRIKAKALHQQGAEGQVYKTRLNTGSGKRDFALKYNFPVELEGLIFTPGSVTMRILQQADREKPVEGLHFVSPLLATYDMSLSLFIPNTKNLFYLLEEFVDGYGYARNGQHWLAEAHKNLKRESISEESRRQLEEIAHYEVGTADQADTLGANIKKVSWSYIDILGDWFGRKLEQDPVLIAHRIRKEDYGEGNILVSVQGLYDLFQRFKQDRTFNADNPEFQKSFIKSCHVVEIGIGSIAE